MNKTIEAQLKKVTEADLSGYNEETNTYIIPRKVTIKPEVDNSYIIHLKSTAFTNDVVAVNWNNGKTPRYPFLKAEVVSKMPGMIRVVGMEQESPDLDAPGCGFWSGWFNMHDIEILQKI